MTQYFLVHRRALEGGGNPPNLCLVLVRASSPEVAMALAQEYAPPDCTYGADDYAATPIEAVCRGVRYIRGDIRTSGELGGLHVALDG